VLPIVPGYLSFISGVNLAEMKEGEARAELTRRVAFTSLAFVLGFSTVFILLGAAATFIVGQILQQYKTPLAFAGGLIIILLGLHTLGVLRIPWLLYERRAQVSARPRGWVGAYIVGLAFAFGWTPCIGPILGTILGLASSQETVVQGIVLLMAYSAGLGIPFLLSAIAIERFLLASASVRRHMRAVEILSGSLLIIIGLLLLTNRLEILARLFMKWLPFLEKLG
jgi:cytochrome c-type biogenesis protein